jgi:uncharacterized protein YaiL (DUF2058 family)
MPVSRAGWEEATIKKETSFERSKRERAEHASEAGAREAIAKTMQPEKKEQFVPSKGGILRVDKALYDAGVY